MPGLAITLQSQYEPLEFERKLSALIREQYQARVILNPRSGLALGHVSYAGYPIMEIATSDGIAIVEGAMIYPDEAAIREKLGSLLGRLGVDPHGARRELEAFCLDADGDFVVALVNSRTGRGLLANDTLGRLQLFFCQEKRGYAIAREIKFLAAWAQTAVVDPDGLADTLLFGWPLDNATLLRGVRRLPIASSIYFDPQDQTIDARPYYHWNFEAMERPAASRAGLMSELTAAFIERCARQIRWAGERPVVASVSGGLDSRSVAAGYRAAGARFTTATYLDAEGHAARDVAVAEQVARALDLRWELVRLPSSTFADDIRLLEMRDGANYIGVSFFLGYLDSIVREHGPRACQVSGEMGQWLFLDMRGPSNIRTTAELAANKLTNAIWPLESVAKLLRLKQQDILDRLIAQFETYPEGSMRYRNVRFTFLERKLRYSLEGEERDRSVLWSMTPRGSPQFFSQVMSIPASLKARHHFYADFLQTLDPEMAKIPYADWNAPLGSIKARTRSYLQGLFPRLPRPAKLAIRAWLLSGHKTERISARYAGEFEGLLASQPVRATFDSTQLERIDAQGCSQFQLQTLLTALMYVGKLGGVDLKSLPSHSAR